MDTHTTEQPEVIEAEVVDDTEEQVEQAAEQLLPVAIHQAMPPAELTTIPGQDEFRAIAQMALLLAQANLVPAPLRRKPHDVFLVLLTGRDLGVPLTTALREAYVIDGKVTVAPALRLAKIRQMGLGRVVPHPDSDLNAWGALPVDANNAAMGPPIWFGWEDAQIAGLVDAECVVSEDGRRIIHADRPPNPADKHDKGEKCRCKDNWRKYPQRMLWWRCAGYCADDYFPEAGLGIYSPDEMGAVTDSDGRPVDVMSVEMPPGWESPGSKPDPIVDDDTVARLQRAIGALTDDEKTRLRTMWKERDLAGLPHLPQRQVPLVEAMIAAVVKGGGSESEGGQGASPTTPDAPAAESGDAADAAWVAAATATETKPIHPADVAGIEDPPDDGRG